MAPLKPVLDVLDLQAEHLLLGTSFGTACPGHLMTRCLVQATRGSHVARHMTLSFLTVLR